jgi:predicted ATPase
LLFRGGHGVDQSLTFKHALVRDTAYESLLRAARREWHQRIAAALEDRSDTAHESEPEVIAQHWIEAGDTRRAIPLLLRAGHNASARSATMEAATHLQRALDLFDALEEDEKNVEQQLEILVSLGPALMNARGAPHPDVRRNWLRAFDVSRRSGTDNDLFPIVWNLWLHHHTIGDRDGTERWRDEIVRLADQSGREDHRLEAYHAVWTSDMPHGLFTKVRAQCDAGLSIYEPERHHHLTYSYGGHDPGVCGHAQAALALTMMGHLDQGIRRAREAIRLAESLNHGPSQTYAWAWWAWVATARRAPAAFENMAEAEAFIGDFERGQAVVDRYGPPHARCRCVLAWAKVTIGRAQEGLAEARSIIDHGANRSSRLSIFLFILAEICLAIGNLRDASSAVDDALRIIERDGERTFWAELMRLRAEIALAERSARDQTVETLFHQAIKVARRQQARLSELRSATRLAKRFLEQGRQGEARNLLAPLYAWFTEGLDTPDLFAARKVLNEMS